MNRNTYPKVLTVGPDIKGAAGISVVLQRYRDHVPGFSYACTNSRHGFAVGGLRLLWLLVRLPFFRIAGYRILHAQGASGKSFYRKKIVISLGRILGFRTIFHCHGGGFRDFVDESGKKRISAFLHKCDAVAVLSEGWKRYFTDELGCSNVHVLHNMVELPEHEAERVPLEPGNTLKLLFIGKICKEKGVNELLEALAAVRASGFDVEAHFAGNGAVEEMRGKASDLGLESKAVFHGTVVGEAKDRLLRSCDVLVLPSYVEGLPLVLLEGASYGMPMLATTVGGIPELVEPGVNGMLVEPRDARALGHAISAYASNPALILKHGEAARKSVEQYLPEAVMEELQRMYKSI